MVGQGANGQRHRRCKPSQQVTEGDVEAGLVRVPQDSKQYLPATRTDVEIVLRGEALGARRWDPRLGPDHERSRVLRVGALNRHVRVGERLTICVDEQDQVHID